MSEAPIVAFANTSWNSLWMNRQHLLSRLAAGGRRVAYSNGVVHYAQFSGTPLRQRAVSRDGVMVMEPGYLIPCTYRASPLRRVALGYHCEMIREALGIGRATPVIGMCFDPDLLDYVDALQPALRVFHIYDSYNKMGNAGSDFTLTRRRIRSFDVITASSAYMYEDVVGVPPDPRYVVPNGVDYAQLVASIGAPSTTAAAIAALPGAKVGYVGSINTKIDFNLVAALAVALPAVSFVFVGPVRLALLRRDARDFADYERMRALPNVHFFGQVPKEELAPVISTMDVTCIYFRVDRADWVEAVYPIKLNEYLAVGKPVISTPIRVVCKEFGDVVAICDGAADWERTLRAALEQGDSVVALERRRRIAASNDWSRRIAHLESLIAATVDTT